MRIKSFFFVFFLLMTVILPVFSQTHNAVPLGDPVYHIIETAQMRGLIGFLPVAKPYSHAKILQIIDEILNFDGKPAAVLSVKERQMLENHKLRLNPPKDGLNLTRGTISGETEQEAPYLSYEFGFGMDLFFAGSYYANAAGYKYREGDPAEFKGAVHAEKDKFYSALDIGPYLSFTGDLGRNNSYGLTIAGRIAEVPRPVLGRGHNIYYEFDEDDPRQITIFGEPYTYFPYTYKKKWDGFLFPYNDTSSSSQVAWPNELSIGYAMFPELSGAALNGHIDYRIARLDREWAGMGTGSSLVLNQAAQPFLAGEITITPFPWISISSLTGILEYHNATGVNPDDLNDAGLKAASRTSQNAFSIVMLELNIKKYFHIDLGSTAVWARRFEIGYLFPFAENFLYQNNIGDFDNMSLFLNFSGQYPGIGKAWFSLNLDEINISESDIFDKDRSMYIYQLGASAHVPWIPFASFTLSYTKNEPYNYTHTRVDTMPWYYGIPMETNYVNAGRSLGHYIPPNSDELLLRLETVPISQARFGIQYQLIRHGADYGDRAVDGSSLWSELDPSGRSTKRPLRKYFLQDGAYQWMNIVKLKGEYSFTEKKMPVKLFAEIGFVYSYFTDIDSDILPNSGSANPYRKINTPQYPNQLSYIGVIGMSIFPKN